MQMLPKMTEISESSVGQKQSTEHIEGNGTI